MFSPIGQEFQNLVIIILIGIAIGIIFDFCRVLRAFWKIGRAGAIFMDISFWFISSIMVIVGLIYSNYGELRLYVFLGLGAGLGIYYYLMSRFIIKLWYSLFYGIITVLGWLIHLILFVAYNVKQATLYILRPFIRVEKKALALMNKLNNIIYKKSINIKNKTLPKLKIRKLWKDFLLRYRKK